jgi:hypothetical protein
MSSLKQFVAVELVVLFALLLIALGMAAYGAADSLLHTNSLIDPVGSAWLGFGYTALIGAPVATVLGAPTYFILARRGLATWPRVLLAGAAPGLIALFASISLGFFAVLCGMAVASVTHAICRRLGPNNSFKPKPLRGSA